MSASQYESPDPADLDAWARATLGLRPGLDADDTRRAILEQLVKGELVPTYEAREAIDMLIASDGSASAGAWTEYIFEREPEVEEQVALFAAAFFSTPVVRRRERWTELDRLTRPWPALQLWLQRLEPALDIELPRAAPDFPEFIKLCRYLGQRFVERPTHRSAIAWQELIDGFADQGYWRNVALDFPRRYPTLAELFALWIGEFSERMASPSRRSRDQQPMLQEAIEETGSRLAERLLQFAFGVVAIYVLIVIIVSFF